MLIATKDRVLPTTVTGSWPRPSWFNGNLLERPFSSGMADVAYREQFVDAVSSVLSDQELAGLDILTNGDYHLDCGPRRALVVLVPLRALLRHLRARHGDDVRLVVPDRLVAQRDRRRLEVPRRNRQDRAARAARVREDLARRAGTLREAGQVRDDRRRPRRDGSHRQDRRVRGGQAGSDVGHRDDPQRRAARAPGRRLQGDPDRGARDPLVGRLRRARGSARLPRRPLQPHRRRPRRLRALDPHLLGQPRRPALLRSRRSRTSRRSTST